MGLLIARRQCSYQQGDVERLREKDMREEQLLELEQIAVNGVHHWHTPHTVSPATWFNQKSIVGSRHQHRLYRSFHRDRSAGGAVKSPDLSRCCGDAAA